MSFNSALTGGNYTSLRGSASVSPSHNATLYVSACPNNNVYTARVNQTTFSASFAQVAFDGASGNLSDIRIGMTVLVSHTNSRPAAFFAGRVRKTPIAGILYFNETSAPFADNDYIFVIDDYRIWDKLARFINSTLYPDYDVTFRQLLPRIYGLKSAYVVATDGSDGTFAFAPSVSAATSGASITTYLWEVADGTITVGTSATQNITATFPPGFRWIHFTVTDNGSRQSTRHIPIWVHDTDNPPAPLEIGDLEWNATIEDGFSGSLPTFDGVDTILDNTLIIAWLDQERYNGTATNIVDNILLLGRFRTEKSTTTYDEIGQQDASTRFEIEGPLQTLARLEINPVEIIVQSSPDAFCEIKSCTPWREAFLMLTEFSTFHELHSVDFDSSDATFADLGVTVPLGSILNGVNSNLFSLNAGLQMNANGQSEGVRDAVMLPTASRGALVTVAAWTTTDILGIDYEHDEVNVIGRSLASGGSYNTTSGKITTTNSIAPGVAQEYPEGSTTLDRQVLAANANKTDAAIELNVRNGHWLARSQGFDTLIIDHPDGYWWLTPSRNQWYTFTLDGSETARGIVLDSNTRWILSEVRGTYHLDSGTFDVQATYQKETTGSAGQTIVYPPQSINPLTLPTLPPIPPFPAFDIGDFFLPDDVSTAAIIPPALFGTLRPVVKHDGNTALTWTSSGVWWCNDFLSQVRPTWIEITPSLEAGETIVACRFVPGPTPGVLVMTNLSTPYTLNFNFAEDDGGWVAQAHSPEGTVAVWISGQGWRGTDIPPGGANTNWDYISLNVSRVTGGILVYDITNGGVGATDNLVRTFSLPNGTGVAIETASDTIGTGQSATNRSFPFTFLGTQAQSILVAVNTSDDTLFRSITLNVSGGSRVWRMTNLADMNTYTAGGAIATSCDVMRIGATFADVYLWDSTNAKAYYSSNYGVSFAAAVTSGTPSATTDGFDTGRLGLVTLAGTAGLARIATTAGGSYSDYATLPTDNVATAIFIPRYTFLGANNGSGVSTPDFLFASEVPASGTGNTLWEVTVSGSVFGNISPTDGGNKGTAVGPNCIHMPWYSTAYQDIMAILDFAGTRKLAVSSNSGSSWVITGALNAAAAYLTTRRSDTLRRQLFITNGSNLGYVSSYRTNPLILAARVGPNADTLLGVDVLP